MRSFIVTKATVDLIRAHADRRTVRGAWQQSDGAWAISLDDEVVAELEKLSPNIDEAIRILCSRQFGRG